MMGATTPATLFSDNDPRESATYIYKDQQIGVPRSEAVYRTNHGYDEYTLQHFLQNDTGTFDYSIQRYLLFPELFDTYDSNGITIGIEEAINITAIVADKDDEHVYDCNGGKDAWNILSVAFDTSELTMYTAWENGVGEEYMCAGCNTYLKINLGRFFA
jgi:hypothetical protein